MYIRATSRIRTSSLPTQNTARPIFRHAQRPGVAIAGFGETPEDQVRLLMDQLRPLFLKNFSKQKVTFGPKVGAQINFRVVSDKDFATEIEKEANRQANSLLPTYLKFAPEKVRSNLERFYRVLKQPLPSRLQTIDENTVLTRDENAAIFSLARVLTVVNIKKDTDKVGAFFSPSTSEIIFRTSIDAGVVAHEMAHGYADQGWHDFITLMGLRGMKQTTELNEGMTTLIERIVVNEWHSKHGAKQAIPLARYDSKFTDRANEFLKQLGRDLAFEAYFGGWIDFTDNAKPERSLVIGNKTKKNWKWPWTHTISHYRWTFRPVQPQVRNPTIKGVDVGGLEQVGDGSLIDIDHVVRMNRQYGETLGWKDNRNQILRLLGIGSGASEKAFAEAVAAWQRRNKVPRSGIINHETWFRMQVALGLLDPPFPSGPFDQNHITNLLFHTRHPERNLAPIKGEAKLIEEWKNIRDQIVRPALRQAPLCEASGSDLDRLADYLRWLNGDLNKKTKDPSRLARLKKLLRLQVKLILSSLEAYIKSGCEEPNLETLRLFVRALPWPTDSDAQTQRTVLINGIHAAQKNALTSSDKRHKQCKGSGIVRLEVRKPKDLTKSFTKNVSQSSLASSAIQIFVPKNATEVSQLEWLHAKLEWICPQATTARGRSGGERGVHRIVWTVTEKQGGACPLNIVGKERLACDGHTYGLAVKPGSTLRESAEKKGFDMDKCEWEFVETFRATTSAYNGFSPLGRCIWGFQFTAKQNIDKSGRLIRSATVKYWGVDKELEVN